MLDGDVGSGVDGIEVVVVEVPDTQLEEAERVEDIE